MCRGLLYRVWAGGKLEKEKKGRSEKQMSAPSVSTHLLTDLKQALDLTQKIQKRSDWTLK